jgi:hypothetical protein
MEAHPSCVQLLPGCTHDQIELLHGILSEKLEDAQSKNLRTSELDIWT